MVALAGCFGGGGSETPSDVPAPSHPQEDVDGASSTSVSCSDSLDCIDAGAAPICDADRGTCVQCLRPADCNDGHICVNAQCTVRTDCDSDTDCTPIGMLCDLDVGYCVPPTRDAGSDAAHDAGSGDAGAMASGGSGATGGAGTMATGGTGGGAGMTTGGTMATGGASGGAGMTTGGTMATGGTGGEAAPTCPVGSYGCPCTAEGSCDSALDCLGGRCTDHEMYSPCSEGADCASDYCTLTWGLCTQLCETAADCPVPSRGTATPTCYTSGASRCELDCNDGVCPPGMYCYRFLSITLCRW